MDTYNYISISSVLSCLTRIKILLTNSNVLIDLAKEDGVQTKIAETIKIHHEETDPEVQVALVQGVLDLIIHAHDIVVAKGQGLKKNILSQHLRNKFAFLQTYLYNLIVQ